MGATPTHTVDMYAPYHAPVRNAYGSDLLTTDLANEETTLTERKRICTDLAKSERDQAAAAEALAAQAQATKHANQAAADSDRRARQAEAEQARATHELRRREAEAKATAAAAAAAQEALDHAIGVHQSATGMRDDAVANAQKCASDARAAEAALTQCAAAEHTCAAILSSVHGEATSSQVGYGGIGHTRAYSALRYPAYPLAGGYRAVRAAIGHDGVAVVER